MESSFKRYYKVGEMSKLLGVPQSAIRFWTKEFSIRTKRNSRNHRLYYVSSFELVKRIRYLLKEERYTLEGAKKRICMEHTHPSAKNIY
jgi:DNA-binding transcriptional MerR regulator